MKRFLLLILSFGLWVLASPAGVLAQTTQTASLSVDPTNGTFNQGCAFSINITLDTGGVKTDGTDAILVYDASRLTATSITNGSVYPDFPGNNIDTQGGKITISGLASVSTPFSGRGTLATINFLVSPSAPAGATQIKFEFDPTGSSFPAQCTQNGTARNSCDSNVVQQGTVLDVLGAVNNGNYIIGTGSCTPQASPSPAPGSGVVQVPGGSSGTTRPGVIGGPGGTVFVSSPSANSGFIPMKTLPPGGTQEFTFMLAILGSALTVLGILGLALL